MVEKGARLRERRGSGAGGNESRSGAESARQALARTFLQRSTRALEELSAGAPSEALEAALEAPTAIGGVATFISDLAPLGIDLSSVDPLAEAIARGTRVKIELLEAAGGGLSSSQVADMLGISRQAVDKRRMRGNLLALSTASGQYVFPACQFTDDGVLPRFAELLSAFGSEGPWTVLSALLAPTPSLRGRTMLEALRGGDADDAIAVAESFGEQGA